MGGNDDGDGRSDLGSNLGSDLGSDLGNVILLPGFGRPKQRSGPNRPPPRTVALPPSEGLEHIEKSGPPADHLIEAALEALLLASDGPATIEQLNTWLEDPGKRRVRSALYNLQTRWKRENRGIILVQVARGWQLRTDVRFSRWVATMRGGKPLRLSKAALETLAVVAYRQPVTRAEIEELRGVDSGGVLRMLCERQLTHVTGRAEVPGRPLIYGTTPGFLSMFGLRDLSDLPTLRDLRALQRDTREGPAAGSAPTPKPERRPPGLTRADIEGAEE
ncbi:MAG: SMC-Scp complex subunit ScpB [Myxococcota bacterium]|nr:SMC-Scp complex subunit ScpB [Myxococcota bacterium]